jgi:PAS domain S-box-containing protein
VSVFDFANLTGHLLKASAYYFLFRAIVETGFYQPFSLLVRELKESETSLLKAQSELEQRVEQRTYQLAQANRDLRSEISERRKVEEALRTSEARFRTIFENTAMGIIVVGMDGIIQSANHGMEVILEAPRQEIEGKNIVDITYGEDVAASRILTERLASGELSSYEVDKRYVNSSGEPVWTHLSINTVLNDDGSPHFIIGIIKDIRERMRAAKELQEIRGRLMNSKEEERLRLARDLHDGPIQELIAIIYHLNQLGQDATPEVRKDLKEVSEQILKANQSLRMITAELRPQALAPFGLEKAIRSHAGDLQQANPDIAIKLKLMSDGQAFPEITRMALYRVYRQSIDNILQHSGADTARITFQFDHRRIWMEIADNGSGFQPPSGWIQLVRGGHFGLAGMSERVEALGGKLEIQSAPGEGTRILVEVPRVTETLQEEGSFENEKV